MRALQKLNFDKKQQLQLFAILGAGGLAFVLVATLLYSRATDLFLRGCQTGADAAANLGDQCTNMASTMSYIWCVVAQIAIITWTYYFILLTTQRYRQKKVGHGKHIEQPINDHHYLLICAVLTTLFCVFTLLDSL